MSEVDDSADANEEAASEAHCPPKIRGELSADNNAALDFDVAEPGCAFTRKVLGCVAADGITLPLLRKEQALEKEAQPAPPPLQQQERHVGHARVDMGGDARTPDIAHRAGRAVGGGNFLAHQKEDPPCEGGEKGDDAKSLSLAEKKDVRDPESKPPVRDRREFFGGHKKEAAAGKEVLCPRKIRREFLADNGQEERVAAAADADDHDSEAQPDGRELVAELAVSLRANDAVAAVNHGEY